MTAGEISKLCDDWCAASTVPAGGIVLGAKTEKFRLRNNGVVFHELEHDALCAAIVGLSQVLLRPRLNAFVVQDHFELWSWCGELLLSPQANLFPPEQGEIKSLYETALHAALAHCRKPVSSKEERQAQIRIQNLQPHHATQLLFNAHLVLAYLTFPLLEGVLKRACAKFVAFDGKVLSPFTILHKKGGERRYAPNRFKGVRAQCSSLRDLLFLHLSDVSSLALRNSLERFREHIRVLDGTEDPFDLIYDWRNQSLHGSGSFQTIGGTILSLSLLISLFEIEHNFIQHRETVLESCRFQAGLEYRSPWSFYPPS
jgi:hypothetical protein